MKNHHNFIIIVVFEVIIELDNVEKINMYQKSTDNDYFVPGFSHPLHEQTVAPSLSIIITATRGRSMFHCQINYK